MPILISRRALRILRLVHAFLFVAGLAYGLKLLLGELDMPPHTSRDWIDLNLPNAISPLWFAWVLSFFVPTLWLLVRSRDVWVTAIGYTAALIASVPFCIFAWAPISAPIERVQKEHWIAKRSTPCTSTAGRGRARTAGRPRCAWRCRRAVTGG